MESSTYSVGEELSGEVPCLLGGELSNSRKWWGPKLDPVRKQTCAGAAGIWCLSFLRVK